MMKKKLLCSLCCFLFCFGTSYARVRCEKPVVGRMNIISNYLPPKPPVQADAITVSIHPAQNMALVCKGNPFVLIAQVTQTSTGGADSDISDDPSIKYEWYYIEGGKKTPIVAAGTDIVLVGNTLTILKGPQLTTNIPIEATAFSVADNIPGLVDILSEAKKNIAGSSLWPDFSTLLNQLPSGFGSGLLDGGKTALNKAVLNYLGDDLIKYAPKEYTVPIGVRVTINGETKEAIPFTRPVFERPNAPKFSITPTSCCEGESITFSSDDNQSDPNKPEVMYMWLGMPSVGFDPSELGSGLALVPNLNKAITKGPFSIVMDYPKLYTGDYMLMAYRGAPSPVGCSSIPATPINVVVYSKPTSDRNTKLKTVPNKSTYCEGEKIKIESAGGGSASEMLLGIHYEWRDPKGNRVDPGNMKIELSKDTWFSEKKAEYLTILGATPDMSGTYTRYAITNKGCKAAATITIDIRAKPAKPVGLTFNAPLCEGDELIISVPPVAGIMQYIWTYPDETKHVTTTPTIERPNVTTKMSGNYKLQMDAGGGCVSEFAVVNVDIVKNFDANTVQITSNSPIVEGATLSLSATLIPNATYKWVGPESFISNVHNPMVSARATIAMGGTYTLTVEEGACNYTGSIEEEVSDKSTPHIINSPLTKSICSGDYTAISLSSTHANTTYTWMVKANQVGKHITYSSAGGIGPDINEQLTNTTDKSETITYTVTPTVEGGGVDIHGPAKDFVVTVQPRTKRSVNVPDPHTMLEDPSQKQGYSLIMKNVTVGNVAKGYVSDAESIDKVLPTLIGEATASRLVGIKPVDVTLLDKGYYYKTPGTYRFYFTETEKGFCESISETITTTVKYHIYLSLNRTAVTAGDDAVLTASLAGTLTAPSGGITITLNPSGTAQSTIDYDPAADIYIPGGEHAGSITITTKSTPRTNNQKIVILTGEVTADNRFKDYYILPAPPELEINPAAVPEITNNIPASIICSGDQTAITLSSTLAHTFYKWSATSTTNAITGFSLHKNNVVSITETLVNTGPQPGIVTYTVTPIVTVGTKDILGPAKDFEVTVMPIAKATIAETDKTSKNSLSFDWSPLGASSSAVTYQWYNERKNLITSGVIADGTYTIQTPKPGLYTNYIKTTDNGSSCASEFNEVKLTVEHEITLSFDKSPIKQGESTILTASLASPLVAPPGGITITLEAVQTSVKLPLTLFIREGNTSASAAIATRLASTIDSDQKLVVNATQADGYTIIGPAELVIERDPSIHTLTLTFDQVEVEGGQVATLKVHLPPGIKATKPIIIGLQRDNRASTAYTTKNYRDLETSIIIPADGNEAQIKAFTALDNGVIDGVTKLVLKGDAPVGYIINSPDPSINIIDRTGDDPNNKTIAFSFKKPIVMGGDIAELMICLPPDITSAKPITITLGKESVLSTAKRNIDYESYPSEVIIPAGKNCETVNIKTIGDYRVSKSTTLFVNGASAGYTISSKKSSVNIISGLHIPNAFTPGEGRQHPTWEISGIEHYPQCTVKVFDRWGGGGVFTSRGYTQPWNGGSQNDISKALPSGTYYYLIDLNYNKDDKRILSGYVAIIR